MTIEQLRMMHRARPFQPFTIHLADGRSIPVVHNDFMVMSPAGRTAVIYQPDESSEIIDLLLVTSIAVAAPTAQPGNGQQSQ